MDWELLWTFRDIMIAFLLLLCQAYSQSGPEAISAFNKVQKMSGEVGFKQADAMLISVTDSSVYQIRVTLTVAYGDADLAITTEIKKVKEYWTSTRLGSDELVIKATDPKFTDKKGLVRSFVIVVVGMSSGFTSYEVTVSAEYRTAKLVTIPLSVADLFHAGEGLETLSLPALDQATLAFTKVQTMTGEVGPSQTDALFIVVKNPAVVQFRAVLKVTTGDCDLYVDSKVQFTDVKWSSTNIGSDELVINKNDPNFTDGKGLDRTFLISVVGVSTTTSAYELTVTAEYAPTTTTLASSSLTHLDSAIFAFTKVQKLTGEVSRGLADGMSIEVTDPAVKQLRVNLKVITGSADFVASAKVEGKDVVWGSLIDVVVEDLVIPENSPKLQDGKGLLRPFYFIVLGMSVQPSKYELTVTAEYSLTYLSSQSVSLNDFLTTSASLELMEISTRTGFTPDVVEDSSLWWTLAGIGTAVGLAAWVWKRSQKTEKEAKYVLL